ncbi:hypothetical protein LIA77_09974 [Sarocladium implicatum]|nr:hypothetical protein LIA77_09974 [Sarocladium implicatum]
MPCRISRPVPVFWNTETTSGFMSRSYNYEPSSCHPGLKSYFEAAADMVDFVPSSLFPRSTLPDPSLYERLRGQRHEGLIFNAIIIKRNLKPSRVTGLGLFYRPVIFGAMACVTAIPVSTQLVHALFDQLLLASIVKGTGSLLRIRSSHRLLSVGVHAGGAAAMSKQ